MKTRMIRYVLITVWALVVQRCYSFHPHEYVSLEAFPDVQVTNSRKVEGWIGLGVDAPVEYSLARHDYELRVSVDETAQMPTAFVRVLSDRPGIAVRREQRPPGTCFGASRYQLTRMPDHLEFSGRCYPGEQDRLSMTFVVVDAGGYVARETVPFRLRGGALQTTIDAI